MSFSVDKNQELVLLVDKGAYIDEGYVFSVDGGCVETCRTADGSKVALGMGSVVGFSIS